MQKSESQICVIKNFLFSLEVTLSGLKMENAKSLSHLNVVSSPQFFFPNNWDYEGRMGDFRIN